MLLQIKESVGLFSDVAQLGVVFGLLVAIIFVLARRVIKLETKIEEMIEVEKAEAKENILIIKNASDAMQEVAKKL